MKDTQNFDLLQARFDAIRHDVASIRDYHLAGAVNTTRTAQVFMSGEHHFINTLWF